MPAFDIAVAITTWPKFASRVAALEQTVASLQKHLVLGEHRWRWICSSETANYGIETRASYERLEEFAKANSIELYYRGGGPTLGGSINQLMNLTSGMFMLYWQDDRVLSESLDVTADCELLLRNPSVGAVRYGPFPYVEGGSWPLAMHDNYLMMDNTLRTGWYFNDAPHLRRPDLLNTIGYYNEKPLGQDEIEMARHVLSLGVVVVGRSHHISHIGLERTNVE